MTRARDVANLQSGAIINEAGADLDFRIESDDNENDDDENDDDA